MFNQKKKKQNIGRKCSYLKLRCYSVFLEKQEKITKTSITMACFRGYLAPEASRIRSRISTNSPPNKLHLIHATVTHPLVYTRRYTHYPKGFQHMLAISLIGVGNEELHSNQIDNLQFASLVQFCFAFT